MDRLLVWWIDARKVDLLSAAHSDFGRTGDKFGRELSAMNARATPTAMLPDLPYFAELDSSARKQVCQYVRVRRYSAGQTILTEGEPCDGLYFVIKGQIRLVRGANEGREHVVRVLGPGATFNDAAVFDGGANSEGAVAVEESTVGLIPKSALLAFIERYPEIARAALKIISARQRTLGAIMEDLALRDVKTRVARLLVGCLGKHEHIIEHAPNACERITHQEIAAMVGSVREVVQRVLKELERDGAVTLERSRIRVLDEKKLKKWAALI
jgi:CRP-like cAMP-binding protein